MLELKNIKKSYKTGDFIQHALKGINLNFRKNEFVSILGASGSGKTTLLNIIGGLDRYDSGDLIINNKSTKKFKEINWDFYRNNCIGFIFQSYNLISHISVIDNVILSTTLSGYKRSKRKKLALDALKKVGLKEHAHKRPNQLSGGQMQRVAIARALVNNPDIILADEPTGALDTKTSKQIMDLIKEISKDKLVIMVTHNPDLAEAYSTRIIELKDGEIINDTNPPLDTNDSNELVIKKTKMSYLSAISLSFNNLKTKFGRTFITSFASSIGIIGIALILALSNGFKIKIDEFEKDTLSQAPIVISKETLDLSNVKEQIDDKLEEYTDKKVVYPLKLNSAASKHINKIDENYIKYIDAIDNNLVGGIQNTYATNLNIYSNINGNYKQIDQNIFNTFPNAMNGELSNIMTDNFEVIEGEYTSDPFSLFLLVDSKNRINEDILKALGFEDNKISFKDLIGKEFKVILNDTLYSEYNGLYLTNKIDDIYNNQTNITLTIKGIIRGKKDNDFAKLSGTGLGFNQSLIDKIVDLNKNSKIVLKQKEANYNILTHEIFENDNNKDLILNYLGGIKVPVAIQIYPNDFNSKEKILKYLDKYNEDKSENNKITYTDQAKLITSLSGNIMDAITIVLIAFSSISLIVSSIMVGIITYTSVLERTKEIGILRAIGARKKDITRVFNAETIIIGLFSGVIGILIANILIIPINNIISNLSGLKDVANLNPIHAILLIIISMTLTLIGGFIPAKVASKKDPVIALRTE